MDITPSPSSLTPSPLTPSPPVVTQTSIAYSIQDKIDAGNRLAAAQTFARSTGLPLSQVLKEQGLDSTGMFLPSGPIDSNTVYHTETQIMKPDTLISAYGNGIDPSNEFKNKTLGLVQQVQQEQIMQHPYVQKFIALDQKTGGALSNYAQSFLDKHI